MPSTEDLFTEIWERLHEWRDLFPEGVEANDHKWNDTCEAMAKLREDMGLPSEVDMELRGRYWINQPSTLQPAHKMHGARVICFEPTADRTVTVYFVEGPIISAQVFREALSEGWPA